MYPAVKLGRDNWMTLVFCAKMGRRVHGKGNNSAIPSQAMAERTRFIFYLQYGSLPACRVDLVSGIRRQTGREGQIRFYWRIGHRPANLLQDAFTLGLPTMVPMTPVERSARRNRAFIVL